MRSDTEPIATLKNIAAEYLCMTVRYDDFSVEWLGYATARLEPEGGPVAYTDPGRYGVLDDYWARDGDIVVVTTTITTTPTASDRSRARMRRS